jgi:NTE family protein
MTALRDRLAGRRFGLVLSAGYFGFFGHAGFVLGLASRGVRPSAWAGTSAGGLIAAFGAAGGELAEVEALLNSLERKSFWDPDWLGAGKDALTRGHRSTGLLAGRRFRALLEQHLPARTFEACRDPLLMLATDLSRQTAHAMTTGELASAVHATCAYPGMFQAVRRDQSLLWDGGLVDKAPALALADFEGAGKLEALVVHYLPSRDAGQEPSGLFAWPQGMTQAMAALRKDHFRLQLQVLAARGVEVHVVTSQLPPVTPKTLGAGAAALEAGRASALAALAVPPVAWGPAD